MEYQDPDAMRPSSWVEQESSTPVSKERNWWRTCLVGCLVTVIVLAVLFAVAGYVAYKRGPAMLARFAHSQIVDQVEQSSLPDEEKKEIVHQLDRVTTAFENGDLDAGDLERIATTFLKSPLTAAGLLMGIEEAYFNSSGLSDEEKERGRRAIQRAWRGCTEERIKFEDLRPVMEIIADEKSQDNWRFKEELTDDELRQFITTLESIVDEHDIPDESFDVTISEELRSLVDELLGPDAEAPMELEQTDATLNESASGEPEPPSPEPPSP